LLEKVGCIPDLTMNGNPARLSTVVFRELCTLYHRHIDSVKTFSANMTTWSMVILEEDSGGHIYTPASPRLCRLLISIRVLSHHISWLLMNTFGFVPIRLGLSITEQTCQHQRRRSRSCSLGWERKYSHNIMKRAIG
jgi:hypothetical protein